MYFTWVGSGLTFKHYARLEKIARDKHSGLLQKSVNDASKKFYSTGSLCTLASFDLGASLIKACSSIHIFNIIIFAYRTFA